MALGFTLPMPYALMSSFLSLVGVLLVWIPWLILLLESKVCRLLRIVLVCGEGTFSSQEFFFCHDNDSCDGFGGEGFV